MVVPLLELFDCSLLVDHHLASDLRHVLDQGVSLHVEGNVRVVLHKGVPMLLSDGVPVHLGGGLVDEASSLIEVDSIRADDTLVSELETVLLLLVDLVPNVDFTLVNKDNLSNFVKLVDQDCASRFISWLQFLEHLHHEVSVLGVALGVVGVGSIVEAEFPTVPTAVSLEVHGLVQDSSVLLWIYVLVLELNGLFFAKLSELEETFELVNEVVVNIRPEQFVLDKLWKLLE